MEGPDELKRAGDALFAEVRRTPAGDVLAAETNAPGVWSVEPANDIEEGGLAGAIGADEAHDPSLRHREVHGPHRHNPAEPFGDALEFQKWSPQALLRRVRTRVPLLRGGVRTHGPLTHGALPRAGVRTHGPLPPCGGGLGRGAFNYRSRHAGAGYATGAEAWSLGHTSSCLPFCHWLASTSTWPVPSGLNLTGPATVIMSVAAIAVRTISRSTLPARSTLLSSTWTAA